MNSQLSSISTSASFSLFSSTDVFVHFKSQKQNFLANNTHLRKNLYPRTTLTLFISAKTNVENLFLELRDSHWWSHESRFLLINDEEHGCDLASTNLYLAWSFHLISVIYLCYDADHEIILHTFNPFTNFAPDPWVNVEEKHPRNGNWKLFRMNVPTNIVQHLSNQGPVSCDVIFFDKTLNLNGYNLKAVLSKNSKNYRYKENQTGWDRFQGPDFEIFSTLLERLNATVTVKMYNTLLFADKKNKTPLGPAKDIWSSEADLWMNSFAIRGYWELQIYPFSSDKIKIATNKRFTDVNFTVLVDSKPWLFLLLTWLVCVVTLKFFLNIPMPVAALEFLRMFLASSTLKQHKWWYRKMIIFFISMMAYVTGVFIHSRLSAIRVVPITDVTIEQVHDLLTTKVPIHSLATMYEIIDEGISNRTEIDNNINDCTDQLKKGENVICICDEKILKYHVTEGSTISIPNFHLLETMNTFMVREDFPLRGKLNLFLMKMSEGGFIRIFYNRDELFHERNIDVDEPDNFLVGWRIGLSILGYGWALSIIVFVIECGVQYLKQ
ncbi:hypothetical protein QAD02_006648 [Eretmocerus hayati]|uniref:Uncharacterized protein n=1 Tax=Eretmocerus hayati TaxID=131215 RepID=A0ACC2N1U9_9HYME|nr:hypothetical protein QAD02_006648 [Eretmocerus hayati]